MATTSRANQEAAADTAYVVRNPRILSGEPTIRGTRIPVRSIIVAFRNYGDVTNVCEAYRLTPEVIDAALAFYAANRDEIDSYIRDNELAVYEASDQQRHFERWHHTLVSQGIEHSGMILISASGPLSRRMVRAAMMLDWVGTQDYHSSLFKWGNLQLRLTQGYRLRGYTDEEVRQALGQV